MDNNQVILLVDDDDDNLKAIQRPIKKEGYQTIIAANGQDALDIVYGEKVDIILLDVMMPGISGLEVCSILKKNPKFRLIPIILVTALGDVKDRINGIEAGADDFLSKPYNRYELLARVRSLLQVKSLTDKLDSAENVIFSLAEAVEAKDSYTRGHAENVSKLALSIGKKMGLDDNVLENIQKGCILHDIGKIGIKDYILNKLGALNSEEFSIMRKHPEIGYEICKPLKSTTGILDMILHHHEKLDGSGYPHGLKGDEITLPIRILTVSDMFDALINGRPYHTHNGLPTNQVFDILAKEVNSNHIDSEVVEILRFITYNKN